MQNKFKEFTNEALQTKIKPLSEKFANYLDEQDELRSYRDRFNFPKSINGKESLYFNSHYLGLMPKDAKMDMEAQLDKWATQGSNGHVEEPLPWQLCDEYLIDDMKDIVGAKRQEVVLMNQLSINLHLMFVTFYRPTKDRYKILCEHQAFPSDHYVFESQLEWHGHNPKENLLTIKPRENEYVLRTEDIVRFIEENGHEISVICMSGIHFFTGQLFDIETITKAGHKMGCIVGWDLAHAVGNVPLKLHDWDIDFAVWCTYKYLNSGAGGMGGAFVHENQLKNETGTYFKGWWGHKFSDRYNFTNEFIPEEGALKYRISNSSFANCILLQTSLKIFKEVGMERLRQKSIKLTNYFEYLWKNKINENFFKMITPSNADERGSQLSLKMLIDEEQVKKIIKEYNIFCDFRKPGVVRITSSALYNSFMDVYNIVEAFSHLNILIEI